MWRFPHRKVFEKNIQMMICSALQIFYFFVVGPNVIPFLPEAIEPALLMPQSASRAP